MPRSLYKQFENLQKEENIESGRVWESDEGAIEMEVDVESDEMRISEDLRMEDVAYQNNPNHHQYERDEAIDGEETLSEIRSMLRGVSTPVLTYVASACIGRWSNTEFDRLLTSQEEEFAEEAEKLWRYNKSNFSMHFLCNSCGRSLGNSQNCNTCLNSSVASFVRIGGFWQITELVQAFLPQILELRKDLKEGKDVEHNLNSPYFAPSWKSEKDKHLHLSTVLSIDGVQVTGNSKKLWPVTLILVDLPAGQMQKSTNIILEGAVECTETPSVAVWNALIPIIFTDIERHEGKVGDITFDCRISTCSADQPAKRAFFGMKSHQSSRSCFYCLAPETFYKLHGESRREARPGEHTLSDSKNGANGFGSTPSEMLHYVAPFDTPIDLLHNLGEGLFEKIRKELFPHDTKFERKSELFLTDELKLKSFLNNVFVHSCFKDIKTCRNGTDKTNYFRLILCLAALECDTLSPSARLVIVSLGMLANKMYTNSLVSELFDVQSLRGISMLQNAIYFRRSSPSMFLSPRHIETTTIPTPFSCCMFRRSIFDKFNMRDCSSYRSQVAKTSPYTIPAHRRPAQSHIATPTGRSRRPVPLGSEWSPFPDSQPTEVFDNERKLSALNFGNFHDNAPSLSSSSVSTAAPPTYSHRRIQATVNGKWSPFGFAATELYDYERGVPLDRTTCEKNIEKLIKNKREVDYYEWLTTAQQCREEGNPTMEKICLGLATSTAMANLQHSRVSKEVQKAEVMTAVLKDTKRGFSMDSAATFDKVLELPSRKFFRISKALRALPTSNWSTSNLRSSVRAFARYIFDEIDKLERDMVCYSSSEKAETYIFIGENVLTSLTDFAIAAFGQTPTRDVKTYFLSVIKDVLTNKLNRIRSRYNAQNGKNSSENAAIWMKEELKKENGALIPQELIFNEFNENVVEELVYDEQFGVHSRHDDFDKENQYEEEETVKVD